MHHFETINFPIRKAFTERTKLWRFYEDSFLGGVEYTSAKKGYLYRHEFEKDDRRYLTRCAQSFYNNQCDSIINNPHRHIFAAPIQRRGTPNLDLLKFYNLLHQEISIDQFFANYFDWSMVYGEMFLWIDGTSFQFDNDQQAKDYGAAWSIRAIKPYDVPCLELDRGTIIRIIFNYRGKLSIHNEDTSTIIEFDQIYIDPEKICLSEIITDMEGSVIDRNIVMLDNPFGMVPILYSVSDRNANEMSESLLADAAPMNQMLYNLDSWRSNALFRNSQPMFTIPYSEEFKKLARTVYGTKKIVVDGHEQEVLNLIFKELQPTAVGSEPKVLTIPMDVIDHMSKFSDYLIEQIRASAHLRTQKLIVQSGLAKQYDAQDENAGLLFFSELAKTTELSFWKLFFMLSESKIKVDEVELSYRKEFDILDKDKEIEKLIRLKRELNLPALSKEIDMILIDIYLSDRRTSDILKRIPNAVEKAYAND